MRQRDSLAEEASNLGISYWKADQEGVYNGEAEAINAFIFDIKNQVNEGRISRQESDLALLIVNIFGLTTTTKLGKLEDVSRRIEKTKHAITRIRMSADTEVLFQGMVGFIEDKYFPERNLNPNRPDIEKLVVPKYLANFALAFENYERNW